MKKKPPYPNMSRDPFKREHENKEVLDPHTIRTRITITVGVRVRVRVRVSQILEVSA